MPKKKPITASEMGRRSWEKQQEKRGTDGQKQEMSRRGKMGGRPAKEKTNEK